MHVIASQLQTHASKKLGCFVFFSDDPKEATWFDSQRDQWGWENPEERKNAMNAVYNKPIYSK
jgi:hypothetical protein